MADIISGGSTHDSAKPGSRTGRNNALFDKGEWIKPNRVKTAAIAAKMAA